MAGKLAETFDWRTCYFIGGGLGLALLALRFGVAESGLFKAAKQEAHIQRGNFLMLFKNKNLLLKYLRLIFIGIPVWYVVGILITFSPELSGELGIIGTVNAGRAVMFCYGGQVIGDLASGSLSQLIQSRKKVLFLFWVFAVTTIAMYFLRSGLSPDAFYIGCGLMGFSIGSWVVFMTAAAEQFGTNIRATVTTTVPNFVRGSVPLLTLVFSSLRDSETASGAIGPKYAAIITGIAVMGFALWAISTLKETYGSELDFHETNQ